VKGKSLWQNITSDFTPTSPPQVLPSGAHWIRYIRYGYLTTEELNPLQDYAWICVTLGSVNAPYSAN